MDSIAAEYRVCKGTACLWVEDTQSKDGTFALPGKKKLKRKPASIHVRCCRKPGKPRPKEPKSVLFREKSGRRGPSLNATVCKSSMYRKPKAAGMILRYAIGNGISNSIPLDAGLGYLGIEQYHANSFIPVKSSKNHQLTKQEKAYNKRLSRRRIVIEHINGRIKTFRCMSYPYLGHYHNRHALRMALICGFINYDRKI